MPRLLRAAVPAALVSAMATHAHAQQAERIGNVDVHLQADSAAGTDLGFAMLRPVGGAVAGALVWACGGDAAGLAGGVYLDRAREDTSAVNVAWRFDQGQPDTTVLRRAPTVHLVGDGDTAPLALRARTASTLTLQVLDAPTAEYRYVLAGVDSALDRLGCARSELSGTRAGTTTLLHLAGMRDDPESETLTGLAVEEPMRVRNTTEYRRHLERKYPPAQLAAGIPGDVVLRFRVLEDGTVDSTSVQVLSSSAEEFNVPSVGALRLLVFHPHRVNGRPAKAWSMLPIEFRIGDSSPTAQPRLRPASRLDMVTFVLRNYPPALRDACVSGQAVVRFRLDANGHPEAGSIEISSSSHEALNDVALRAAHRLRYNMPPPRADGLPANDAASETIHFLLPRDCRRKVP